MRVLHAILFIVLPLCAGAQSFPYRHYSVKDGLPHANVYAITEDSLGYMWFGTEHGLVRFDGKEFVSFFGGFEPLSHSPVTALQFTADGNLYAGTLNNGVYRIGSKDIATLRQSKGPVLAVSSLGIQEGHVFVFHEFINAEVIPDAGNTGSRTSEKIRFDTFSNPLCSRMLSDGSILVGRKNGLFRIKEGVENKWVPENYQGEAVYTIYENADGDLYLGCAGKILHIRKNKVVSATETGIRTGQNIKVLLRDKSGNFWFGFWGDDNLYVLTPEGSVFNIFENSGVSRGIVSRIHNDSNGDVWLSVLGQGVYRFSGLYLRNSFPGTSSQSVSLTCMDFSNDKYIIFGTHNGVLFYNRENNTYFNTKLSPALLEYVRDIRITGKTIYAGITDMRLEEMKVKEKIVAAGADTFLLVLRHASSIEPVEGGLLLGNWDNEIVFEDAASGIRKKILKQVYRTFESLRINCLLLGNDSSLFIGTPLGLIIYDMATGLKMSVRNNVLSSGINRIVRGSRTGEIIVYAEKGVAMMKGTAVVKCYENTGPEKITAMSDPGDGSLFAGTTNGLYYFSQADTVHIDMTNGLPSNQVNDLRFDHKHQMLIIITANGFSQISLPSLQNHPWGPPRVLVSGIETAKGKLHFAGPMTLPYTEKIKILTLSSLGSDDPGRMIRIRSTGGREYLTFSGKFDLSELPPGNNTLRICYVDGNGIPSRETTLEIKLLPPFYRTSWFYLLAGISGTGLTMLGLRKRKMVQNRKHLEQNRVEYKMNLLKQQALVSNLNPHFIFNALNAIQAFINNNDLKNANEYLALFSRLMRRQLNTAGRDLIPVSEEIERLRNYLDIEKLRFGDKLDYRIETDERIRSLEVNIPNMIIQPFLENSIWHGFKGMKEKGLISLSMAFDADDRLIITVTDNGKGIRNADPSAGPSKDPRGISLIRDRLELMSDPGTPVISFSQLSPGTPLPGTVVTIRLTPKMYRVTS